VISKPVSQPLATLTDEKYPSCSGLKYVRRDDELKRLKSYLDKARSGSFQLCLVTGEAGSGKTALITEFVRRSQRDDNSLVAAMGNCNAQIGEGDPYLPFIELLSQLMGDVEAKLAEERVTNASTDRLRSFMKTSAKVLITEAPAIISTFLPGSPLFASITETAIKQTGILEKLDRMEETIPSKEIDKDKIFQEYANLLSVLSKHCPLVLVLDNLQWADSASIDLFLHLSYRLKESRILLIGAYRPDDVAMGRKGNRHPLTSIISNLKRYFGDIWLNLDEISEGERKAFISDILDCEPNLLGSDFRESFFCHTAGHPLFTVELTKELKDRGDLVRDRQGRWIVGDKFDWNILPTRVEGVIEERMDRLEEDMRDILTVASVEGIDFTAQVICQIEKLQERDLLKHLSRDLEKTHRLIKEGSTERIGQNWLSHYSFAQTLFQQYLYDGLTLREKSILHGAIAEVLADFYAGDTEAVAVKLARHYELAGNVGKAVEYHLKSAYRALRMSAYEEALGHLRSAADMVSTMAKGEERDNLDLEIQISLSSSLKATLGFDSPEVFSAFNKARELCERLGQIPKLSRILFGLWTYHLYKLNLNEAYEIANECLKIGTKLGDNDIILEAHIALGNTLYWMGMFSDVYDHMQQVFQLYNPRNQADHVICYGQDPRVVALMFSAFASSVMGYMDRAMDERNKMLKLAEEISHPFSTAIALQGSAILDYHLRDAESALVHADALIDISTKNSLPLYLGIGVMIRGWALSIRGNRKEGVKQVMDGYNRSGGRMVQSMNCLMLAEAYGDSGDVDKGLQLLEEGLVASGKYGDLCYEAEMYREKAELLIKRSDLIGAEADLKKSLSIAVNKGAKLFYLRAAVSLGKLLKHRGEDQEACRLLSEACSQFPIGSDLADLRYAEELLRSNE
jgi:tetratricopeptide (TPR) repeat protein